MVEQSDSIQDSKLTAPVPGAVLPPSEPKPGFKTTEFWITLGFQAVGVALLLGYVKPNEVDDLNLTITKAIEAIGVLVSMAVVVIKYTTARENTKLFSSGGKS